MRAIQPNNHRRSRQRTVLLTLMAIVIGGAGTVAALAALKVIDPEKLAFWRERRRPIPADWVAIPFCVRPIPAYTRVTREYLMIDLKNDNWALRWYPPKKVPAAAIRKIKDILGRVTAREKPAAYAFVESDFLPPGSSPGVAGGTPEGKRAITLDAGKLNGVYDLKEGDHVDLLASVSVDMPGAGHSNSGRLGTSIVATPNMDLLLPKRGYVRSLVQDGVVVTPVRIRNAPTSSSSLTQGATTRTRPVQEIVLAVDPEEVAPLAEAMDLKYEITCVTRSGRPMSVPSPAARSSAGKHTKSETPGHDRAAADITPGLNPLAQIRFMEVMIGSQRQFVLFTGPGNSPVVAPQDDGSAKVGSVDVPTGAVE
jgi:Flp pilus assembly protein CpaB